jgi:hypothetical protein
MRDAAEFSLSNSCPAGEERLGEQLLPRLRQADEKN